MLPRQGVVDRVFTKEVQQDQYGNKFLISFKLQGDDTYYGCGKKKFAKLSIKKGTQFHDVQAGDSIAFFAEETEYNGKTYWNVKSSGITLVAAGNGASAPAGNTGRSQSAAAAPSRPAAAPSTGPFSGNELSIKAGRAVNAAVLLVTSGFFKGSLEDALARAIALEQYADAKYNDIYRSTKEAAEYGEKVQQAAEQQNQAAQQQSDDDDFSDDIPF